MTGPDKTPIYRRTWVAAVAAGVVGLGIGVLVTSGDDVAPLASGAPVPTTTVTMREVFPVETVTITGAADPAAEAATDARSAELDSRESDLAAREQALAAAESPVPPPDPPEAPDVTSELSDGGWDVESFDVGEDGLGDFDASARIANNSGEDVEGAIFTLTVLEAGTIVTSLSGTAQGVEAGGVATVDFFTSDDYRGGDFTYDFQVDMSY